jgi:hypothetical protein
MERLFPFQRRIKNMNSKQKLQKYLSSDSFLRYMDTNGVKEYKYFAGVKNNYTPSLADAAMAQYESIGKEVCLENGIRCEINGEIFVDEESIGKSVLSYGKTIKGITISMWLEDVGTFGFSTEQLRVEVDQQIYEGWFDNNVTPLITNKVCKNNYQNEIKINTVKPERYSWYETKRIWVRELPTRWKVRMHYFFFDLKKKFKNNLDLL